MTDRTQRKRKFIQVVPHKRPEAGQWPDKWTEHWKVNQIMPQLINYSGHSPTKFTYFTNSFLIKKEIVQKHWKNAINQIDKGQISWVVFSFNPFTRVFYIRVFYTWTLMQLDWFLCNMFAWPVESDLSLNNQTVQRDCSVYRIMTPWVNIPITC